jgi:hypothetical protein
MLNNSTYDLMETAAVLSKGLHRYGTFHRDAKSCPDCQQIWSYMQQTDEQQLQRIVAHLKEHLGTGAEVQLVSA